LEILKEIRAIVRGNSLAFRRLLFALKAAFGRFKHEFSRITQICTNEKVASRIKEAGSDKSVSSGSFIRIGLRF